MLFRRTVYSQVVSFLSKFLVVSSNCYNYLRHHRWGWDRIASENGSIELPCGVTWPLTLFPTREINSTPEPVPCTYASLRPIRLLTLLSSWIGWVSFRDRSRNWDGGDSASGGLLSRDHLRASTKYYPTLPLPQILLHRYSVHLSIYPCRLFSIYWYFYVMQTDADIRNINVYFL